MKKFLFLLLLIGFAQALIIEQVERPLLYPGKFSSYKVVIKNDEKVERYILIYLAPTNPELLCFFKENATAKVIYLEPNEEEEVEVIVYVLRGAKSGNYSCKLYHSVALSERAEEEFKNLTIIPSVFYKDVTIEKELKKVRFERNLLLAFLIILSFTFLFKKIKSKKD